MEKGTVTARLPAPHEGNAMHTKPSTRALVVDDSAFMRKVVSEILRSGGVEVVATARDGVEGLAKARELRPDVITLDVEMPRMSGVEFLRELMRTDPMPVVMLSSVTESGTATAIKCLELGAVDCLHKPSGAISLDIAKIAPEIVATVVGAAKADLRKLGRGAMPAASSAPASATTQALMPVAPAGVVTGTKLGAQDAIVLIASSTGGPAALQQVVPKLPGDLQAGVVLVQHLPPGFTRSLASSLDRNSALSVREAAEGDTPRKGVVLVAPAGWHLGFDSRGVIRLNQDPPMWGVRPAADVMMCSAADVFGPRLVGAVLTGMGRDGALGAKAIRSHGGYCVAQDEATCVVWGMPRSAYEMGGADRLAPLDEIAGILTQAVGETRSRLLARSA